MVPPRSSPAEEAEMETLKFNTGRGVPDRRTKEPNAAGTQGAEPLILSSWAGKVPQLDSEGYSYRLLSDKRAGKAS